MIKKNNKPLFHPTFGSRPAQIVGREELIQDFLQGLDEPVGSRERCRFYKGQRGMGKTALLLELADRAEEKGFVCARVTAYEGMNEDIIETIQRNGSKYIDDKNRITGASAGAFGFSFGLTFTKEAKEQFGFRTKLTMLCDELEKHEKGVLILVDEACASKEMRELAVTYQHLVGEEKNIAIAMAGLPQAVSGVLNDEILTFLNRAVKTDIGPIRTSEIEEYYKDSFEKLGIWMSEEDVRHAARAAEGFPYLMQLIGFFITKNASIDMVGMRELIDYSIDMAKEDMKESVFAPILKPLSDNDLMVLRAMAQDEGVSKTRTVCERIGRGNSFLQPYRARLIDAGIVESPRSGELVFAVPYLAEYLRAAGN
jgi:hypothetical protein